MVAKSIAKIMLFYTQANRLYDGIRDLTEFGYNALPSYSSIRHTLLLQHDAPNYVSPIISVMSHLS